MLERTSIIAVIAALGFSAMDTFGETPPLPQWYLDTGLSTVDTDGDGIPDVWEQRAFSDPAVPDSGLDRDGDGLTDLEEFLLGSDPRTFSTMGDGWSDKEKRDAGLSAVFRVSPAVSLAQWLGWLGWTEQKWRTLTATNEQGFATCYAEFVYNTQPYLQEQGAADLWLVTRTDRPAWLTIGDALTTNSFPVRAGSGRVHIRAAYGGPVSLTLDPLPGTLAELPSATNGLWLCEMSVEPFRLNTVVFSDGDTPSVSGDLDSVDGLLLLSAPPASVHSLTSPPPAITLQPLRMTDGGVDLGNGGWYCLCDSAPSCDWPNYAMIGCDTVSMTMNGVQSSDPILPKDDARAIYQEQYPCIQCTVTQSVANAMYPFIYGKVIFSFRQCEAIGGVSGAEQHQPWHEPGYSDHSLCNGIGCMCDDGPHWVIGFDHAAVNTRNLSRIPTGDPDMDSTEHCLGVVWEKGEKVDLFSLLDASYQPYKNDLSFTTTALSINNDGELVFGGKLEDLEPEICLIKLHYSPTPEIDQVFDKLWVIVNAPEAQARFTAWHEQNANISWTNNLPPPFSGIAVTNATPFDPETGAPNQWGSPHGINSYLHHDAKYEMRSGPVSGGHGHQATYNANGMLIEDPIAAGTADIAAPYYANDIVRSRGVFTHKEQDVKPFLRALQLDGNPVRPTNFNRNLNRPCIYKGLRTDKYIEKRPVLPTGKKTT